jgi:hypothetical protein
MHKANPIGSLGRPDGRALMAKVSQHHALRAPYGSHHGSGGKHNAQEVNPGKTRPALSFVLMLLERDVAFNPVFESFANFVDFLSEL